MTTVEISVDDADEGAKMEEMPKKGVLSLVSKNGKSGRGGGSGGGLPREGEIGIVSSKMARCLIIVVLKP